MPRGLNWIFTLNNYTTEEVDFIRQVQQSNTIIRFLIFGFEVGEQGTPHLQGYLELCQKKTLASMRRILPRCHLEIRRGSQSQAIEYCQKEGEYEEFGEKKETQQGKRSDLEALHTSLKVGMSLLDISNEHFGSFVRYHRAIRSWQLLNAPRIREQPSVVVYWGQTGSGKTRSVWDNAPTPEDVWVYGGNGWFDGYHGQRIALFDDFNGGELQLTMLLKVLDRYPLQVPIKGGFVSWTPEEIYITSNLNPEVWYMNARPQHQAALHRRFTNVVYFE